MSPPSSKELVEVERVDHDMILRDKSIMVAGSVLNSNCLRNQHLQQHGNLQIRAEKNQIPLLLPLLSNLLPYLSSISSAPGPTSIIGLLGAVGRLYVMYLTFTMTTEPSYSSTCLLHLLNHIFHFRYNGLDGIVGVKDHRPLSVTCRTFYTIYARVAECVPARNEANMRTLNA